MATETPQLNMDDAHLHLYRSYGCDNAYHMVSGDFALPVAEDPPEESELDEFGQPLLASWSPVVIVKAHAPYRVRTALFQSEKQGSPPLVPTPQSGGAFSYMEGDILFGAPKLNSDGRTYTWSVSGSYTFVETVRSDPRDGFVLTSLPAITTLQVDSLKAFGDAAPNKLPVFGAIAQAGNDAKMGYVEARENFDLEGSDYAYNNPAYFPPQSFNDGLVNGQVTFTTTLSGGSGSNSSLGS